MDPAPLARAQLVIVGYHERLVDDHQALMAAARAGGFEPVLADPSQLALLIDTGATTGTMRPIVTVDGRPCQPAVALPRGVNRPWPLVRQFLEVWSAQGTAIVPSLEAADRVADKVITARVLAAAGVAVMATIAVIPGPGVVIDADAQRVALGHDGPVIVKPARGSKARGVDVHDSVDTALTSLRALRPLVDDVVDHQVIQPLATGAGTDYRVIVARTDPSDVPPRTIAVTRRQAPAGTIITNRAGSINTDIDPATVPDISRLAETAAAALGLDFGGIDIIEHVGKPVVLEANAWPGLAPEHRGQQLADALIAVANRVLGQP